MAKKAERICAYCCAVGDEKGGSERANYVDVARWKSFRENREKNTQ